MPCIAIMALLLLLAPTYTEGHLQTIHPAATAPTRLLTGPQPPQLPYIAA